VAACGPQGCRLQAAGGHVIEGRAARPLAEGQVAAASVRPEQVALRRRSQGAEAGLPVQILTGIFLGEHTEYLLRHDGLGEFLALVPRQAEAAQGRFAPGEEALASWPQEAALILGDG
jgi:spermidine/putrescine transport system ATP-binding protein